MWSRPLIDLSLCLVCLALVAGCRGGSGDERAEAASVLQPTRYVPPEASRNVYKLRTVYLVERLGLRETERVDLWRFLDELALPAAQRRLLAANGLRLAVGGELAMKRIDALLKGRTNVIMQQSSDVTIRQGYALELPYGWLQNDMDLLWSRHGGLLVGDHLDKATTYLRLQCLAGKQPDTTDMILGEWVLYGEKEPAYRRTPTGLVLSEERPKLVLDDLRTRVTLREGQILVIGLAEGRPLSFGEHLLVKQTHELREITTIILSPQLLAPGEVPTETPPAAAQISPRVVSPGSAPPR